MRLIRQLVDNYYKPKAFEVIGNKTIYEFIGIKFYKKYLLTSGDLVRRWRNTKKTNVKSRLETLQEFEWQTRNYEWRHLVGLIVFIALLFIIQRKFTLNDWIFLFFLNLAVNLYPIFLQRYNRIRILSVLEKCGVERLAATD